MINLRGRLKAENPRMNLNNNVDANFRERMSRELDQAMGLSANGNESELKERVKKEGEAALIKRLSASRKY